MCRWCTIELTLRRICWHATSYPAYTIGLAWEGRRAGDGGSEGERTRAHHPATGCNGGHDALVTLMYWAVVSTSCERVYRTPTHPPSLPYRTKSTQVDRLDWACRIDARASTNFLSALGMPHRERGLMGTDDWRSVGPALATLHPGLALLRAAGRPSTPWPTRSIRTRFTRSVTLESLRHNGMRSSDNHL